MFDINKITPVLNSARFSCVCQCDSVQKAEDIVARHLIFIRQNCGAAELSVDKDNKTKVILDTPNKEITKELAIILNNRLENTN